MDTGHLVCRLEWRDSNDHYTDVHCTRVVALQNVKIDLFIRHPQGPQGKMVHLILAILVGRAVAQFFVDYWSWTQSLRFLF